VNVQRPGMAGHGEAIRREEREKIRIRLMETRRGNWSRRPCVTNGEKKQGCKELAVDCKQR